jgi:hypothetical protein
MLPFAAVERLDTWVLKCSIAIFLVFVALLFVLHVGPRLARKVFPKRRIVRHSPEPADPFPLREHRRTDSVSAAPDIRLQALAQELADRIKDDPERLQQTCAGLTNVLAEMYFELAESWLRKGQTAQALSSFEKLIQCCPETRHAQLAQNRLRQLST